MWMILGQKIMILEYKMDTEWIIDEWMMNEIDKFIQIYWKFVLYTQYWINIYYFTSQSYDNWGFISLMLKSTLIFELNIVHMSQWRLSVFLHIKI